MKEEGRQRLVLRESRIILTYARVWTVEGRASWETVWLQFISLYHTALARTRGLRKLGNNLLVFCFFLGNLQGSEWVSVHVLQFFFFKRRVQPKLFFFFWNPQASASITSGTHTVADG